MQIESIIRRKNGTTVVLDGTEYHFNSPIVDGPHVATVENDAHIQRFLSIPEGFKIYRTAKVEQQPEVVSAGTPLATDVPEGVQPAMTVDELKAAYEAKFGKKPHHKMSATKLREALSQE